MSSLSITVVYYVHREAAGEGAIAPARIDPKEEP